MNKYIEGKIIRGDLLASDYNAQTAEYALKLVKQYNIIPSIAIILVGDNPASHIYVSNKIKTCNQIGIKSHLFHLDITISENELIKEITKLNNDININGILIQMPLPEHISLEKILMSIDPVKDVDGFSPYNMGKLAVGIKNGLKPCTPLGCIKLIEVAKEDLSGLNAVVIGRSNIVGKPMSLMLLEKNCTVTIAHSKTKNLSEITKNADILIAAMGKPKFITSEMVKEGAIMIDVGISREDNKIVGDVDIQDVINKISYITPVPKGVGPMTIAMLMLNVVKATCMQNNVDINRL